MMEVKGAGIKSTPDFVKEKFGDEMHQKWLASLTPESKKIFTSPILPSVWYPYEYGSKEPLKKIVEVVLAGDQARAREFGEFIAEKTLSGIYKAFVRLGTPNYIIKKASSIFSTFFRPSKLEIAKSEDKHVIVHISEFSEIEKYAEYSFAGFIKKALEICGCQNPKTTIKTFLSKGDPYTEIDCTWD